MSDFFPHSDSVQCRQNSKKLGNIDRNLICMFEEPWRKIAPLRAILAPSSHAGNCCTGSALRGLWLWWDWVARALGDRSLQLQWPGYHVDVFLWCFLQTFQPNANGFAEFGSMLNPSRLLNQNRLLPRCRVFLIQVLLSNVMIDFMGAFFPWNSCCSSP